MANKEEKKKLADAAIEKAEKREPKVRARPAALSFEWALNPMKLGLATTHVDTVNPGLTGEARHDAIKARYIELKGRLPGEKRHKDGKHETGTPRPSSEQAIAYDAGEEATGSALDEEDDDDEDIDGTVEEQL